MITTCSILSNILVHNSANNISTSLRITVDKMVDYRDENVRVIYQTHSIRFSVKFTRKLLKAIDNLFTVDFQRTKVKLIKESSGEFLNCSINRKEPLF